MAGEIFKQHEKFKDKPIVLFEDIPFVDFYKVNKAPLELSSTKEERLSQLYISPNDHDKVILSKVQKVITTIVNTTSPFKKPSLQINHLEGNNSAALEGNVINVSLNSLYDYRIPLFARINNIVANAFHEALHVRHTTPALTEILLREKKTKRQLDARGKSIQVPDFERVFELFENGNQLYMQLHNIMCDRRIEGLGVKKSPGYVYYLEESRQYALFLHHIAIENKKNNLGDLSDFENLYDAVFYYILYKVLLPEIVPFFLKKVNKVPKFVDLMYTVDTIVDTNSENFSFTKNQAHQLFLLFPNNYKPKLNKPRIGMFAGTAIDGNPIKSNKELESLLEEISTDEKTERQINPSEGFQQIESIIELKTKPFTPDFQVFEKARKISKDLSKNLSFVDAKYNRLFESYELASGLIEEGDLALAQKNKFVFFEEDEIPHYNLDFGILIDESGSMSGLKIEKAKAAAIALTLALSENKFINLFVWGHTANTYDNLKGVTVFDYYNSENPKANINCLFNITAKGNNADGFAIKHVGDILIKRKAKKSILVVVSDGVPHAYGYGNSPAIAHTKQMVESLESRGVYVIQIAIDSLDSSKMFNNFIEYSEDSLGRGLKKILSKQLIQISNQI